MPGEMVVSKVERDVDYAAVDNKDFYGLLGVSRRASTADITKAYRRLALKYHPDKNASPEAAAIFGKIKKAYEVLSDPEQRRHFDETGDASDEGSSRYMDDMYRDRVPVPREQRRLFFSSREAFLAWFDAGRPPLREPASKAEFLAWIEEDAARHPDTESIVWASRGYDNQGLWDKAVVEDNLWRLIEGGFLSYADFEEDVLKKQTVWEAFFNNRELVDYFCANVNPRRGLGSQSGLFSVFQDDIKKFHDLGYRDDELRNPWYYYARLYMYGDTAVDEYITTYRTYSLTEESYLYSKRDGDVKAFEYLTLASRHSSKTSGYFTEKRACLLAFLYKMGSIPLQPTEFERKDCPFQKDDMRQCRRVLDEMRAAYTNKQYVPSLMAHLMMIRSERVLALLQQYDAPSVSTDQPRLSLEALVEQLTQVTLPDYYVPEMIDHANKEYYNCPRICSLTGRMETKMRPPDIRLTRGHEELYVIEEHIVGPFRKKIQALEKSRDALSKKKARQLRIVVSNIKDIVVKRLDERVQSTAAYNAALKEYNAAVEEYNKNFRAIWKKLYPPLLEEKMAQERTVAEEKGEINWRGGVYPKGTKDYEHYISRIAEEQAEKEMCRIIDERLPRIKLKRPLLSEFSRELCQEVLATLKNFEKRSKIGEHRNLIGAFLKAFICGVVSVITLGTAFYYSQGVRNGFFMRTNTSALVQEQQAKFVEAQKKYMPKKA